MKYQAHITIMPLKELLDPQGKTVQNNLPNLDIHGVEDVRIGKHVVMRLEAPDETTARERVDTACRKLLANLIMESYSFELSEIDG